MINLTDELAKIRKSMDRALEKLAVVYSEMEARERERHVQLRKANISASGLRKSEGL